MLPAVIYFIKLKFNFLFFMSKYFESVFLIHNLDKPPRMAGQAEPNRFLPRNRISKIVNPFRDGGLKSIFFYSR